MNCTVSWVTLDNLGMSKQTRGLDRQSILLIAVFVDSDVVVGYAVDLALVSVH